MASLTLLEQSQFIEDSKKLAVIAELRNSEVLDLTPFMNVEGGAYAFVQEDESPDADFRVFDEAQDDSLGSTKPQAEVLKIFGKDIKTDLFGIGAHRRQVEAAVRAIRMRYEETFINGNADTPNVRHFDGLRKRLNTGSSQAIANHVTAGPLSLAALDEALDAVDAAPGDKVLIVPKATRRALSAAMRNPAIGGNINMTKDDFGRQIMTYGDARVIATDVNTRKQPIQGFTESNSTCSIYALAFGDDMVTGIQGRANGAFGLAVYDIGELHVTPTYMTRIKWHISMVIENSRAAARLYNITNAAVVA
jgi:hypothetical protein